MKNGERNGLIFFRPFFFLLLRYNPFFKIQSLKNLSIMKKISNLKIITALTHYYFMAFFIWLVLSPFFGDRWWWLFLLNSFSVYFFFLLPLPLTLAIITRKRSLLIGTLGIFLAGLILYGGLFLPSFEQNKKTEQQLSVMTFNLLGSNTEPAGVISSIRASDAEIIAFQELNPEIAREIEKELLDEYPYQLLAPERGVVGMGLISRYPFRENSFDLQGRWVGKPQILEIDWEKTKIILINFHASPPGSMIPFENLISTAEKRNLEISALRSFANSREEPLIVLGDLNITEQNDAYKILSTDLQDTWREKGWGLGHTFPGAASPGSSRITMAGIPLTPKWLLRLDYIFCSDQWQVESAFLSQWDGVSDHRPVKATISLKD